MKQSHFTNKPENANSPDADDKHHVIIPTRSAAAYEEEAAILLAFFGRRLKSERHRGQKKK